MSPEIAEVAQFLKGTTAFQSLDDHERAALPMRLRKSGRMQITTLTGTKWASLSDGRRLSLASLRRPSLRRAVKTLYGAGLHVGRFHTYD